jgi:hypothetical protein
VCTTSSGVGIEDRVVLRQTGSHVVGVQEGDLSSMGKATGSHHLDVRPRDREDRSRSPGCGGDGGDSVLSSSGNNGVTRQEVCKVRLDSNGSNSGSSSSVGDTEGLVQVKMADIGTDFSGGAKSNLGVHVGSVHVNLSSELVDNLTSLLHLGLENSVGGGVGNHNRGKLVLVLLGLELEVGHVKISGLGVALDSDNAHSAHRGGGRVGSVGGGGDQTDVALVLSLGLEVGADDTETGEFSLGSRVGLERDGIETGDVSEVGLELVNEYLVTLGLVEGNEGVEGRELGPGDGEHLSGGVELHGARSEGDHGVGKRQILGLEVVDVTEHLSLGVVLVEDGVLEVSRGSLESLGDGSGSSRGDLQVLSNLNKHLLPLQAARNLDSEGRKSSQDILKILHRNSLVHGNGNTLGVKNTKVDSVPLSDLCADILSILNLDRNSVEESTLSVGTSVDLESHTASTFSQDHGQRVNTLSNRLQPSGSVVDSVHSAHVCKKSLSGTDVGSSLLTTNVLLTGLESETVGRVTETVLGNSNETSGHLSLHLVGGSKERGVGSSVSHGNTEALGISEGDISAELSRGLKHSKGEEVGSARNSSSELVNSLRELSVVVDRTISARVLNENTNEVIAKLLYGGNVERISNLEVDSESLSAGLKSGNGLGVDVGVDKVGLVCALLTGHGKGGEGHGHGLSGGGGLVENGGIGDSETGKVGDDGLEVDEGLETSWGRLACYPAKELAKDRQRPPVIAGDHQQLPKAPEDSRRPPTDATSRQNPPGAKEEEKHTLRDLRLVRSVRSVPLGALEDVTGNNSGGFSSSVSATNVRARALILRSNLSNSLKKLSLRETVCRADLKVSSGEDIGGDDVTDKGV